MNAAEQQEEEREVLLSIYEGDDNFFDLAVNKYQYKIGKDGESKSMLVEISWGENYPDEQPNINLDAFFNNHLLSEVKESVTAKLIQEAEALLGCAATYTLFEFAKESVDSLLEVQPEILVVNVEQSKSVENVTPASKNVKEKKEVLTKNQKRRLYDRFGTQGMEDERPRGWDWVDVVKHLCQTGAKSDGQ